MILFIGVGQGEERLNFVQSVPCPCCGQYGRYEVFVRFSVFNLFFIPLFRFSKEYFVRTSCCGRVAKLTKETGRMIERGEVAELRDLRFTGYGPRSCGNCGYPLDSDFAYCPKCGSRI